MFSKAANYLDFQPLLEVTCKHVANLVKGKSPEDIRRTFKIKNSFTPEEVSQPSKFEITSNFHS